MCVCVCGKLAGLGFCYYGNFLQPNMSLFWIQKPLTNFELANNVTVVYKVCALRKKKGFVLSLNWVCFHLHFTSHLLTAGKPELTTKQCLACLYSWTHVKECVFHRRKKKTSIMINTEKCAYNFSQSSS